MSDPRSRSPGGADRTGRASRPTSRRIGTPSTCWTHDPPVDASGALTYLHLSQKSPLPSDSTSPLMSRRVTTNVVIRPGGAGSSEFCDRPGRGPCLETVRQQSPWDGFGTGPTGTKKPPSVWARRLRFAQSSSDRSASHRTIGDKARSPMGDAIARDHFFDWKR